MYDDKKWWRPGSGTLAHVTALFFLVVFWVSLSFDYYLKAYSDPLNYLTCAESLEGSMRCGKWPVLFPAILRLALPICGRYGIFLFNVVPVSLLLITLGKLSELCVAGYFSARVRDWLSPVCIALLLVFDLSLWITLVNPYRDPTAMLFLVLSLMCLVAYLRDARSPAWLVLCSGVCLGASASVREPNILIGVPMAMLGAHHALIRRDVPIWKSVLCFSAGVTVGLAPLLVQSYMFSGNALVPPQAAAQNELVPGMRGTRVWDVMTRSCANFTLRTGVLWWTGIGMGLFVAIKRRIVPVLLLILPAGILYFVFYSFYECFVLRYFLIVVLFLGVLASVGWGAILELLLRIRSNRARAIVVALLALAFSGVWLFDYASSVSWGKNPRFQIEEARAFARALAPYAREDAMILCPRNLCEVIRWFTPAEAYNVHRAGRKEEENGSGLDALIHRHIENKLDSGQDVYVICSSKVPGAGHGTAHISRFFDLDLEAEWDVGGFNLGSIWSNDRLVLYRVMRWRGCSTKVVVSPKRESPLGVRVDVGALWAADSSRSQAHIEILQEGIRVPAHDGGNYVLFSRIVGGDPIEVQLQSDRPVPRLLHVEFLYGDRPALMEFGHCAVPSLGSFLSDGFACKQDWGDNYVAIYAHGSVQLPVLPVQTGNMLVIGADVAADGARGSGPVGVAVRFNGEIVKTLALPPDESFKTCFIALFDHAVNLSSRAISFDVFAIRAETGDCCESRPMLMLKKLSMYFVPTGTTGACDIGSLSDGPTVAYGFYGRERESASRTVRWTGRIGTLNIYLDAVTNLYIDIVWSGVHRHPDSPDSEVSFVVNGHVVAAVDEGAEAKSTFERTRLFVDAEQLSRGCNVLALCARVWRPSDYVETRDSRELGVMVDRVEWTRAPASPHSGGRD